MSSACRMCVSPQRGYRRSPCQASSCMLHAELRAQRELWQCAHVCPQGWQHMVLHVHDQKWQSMREYKYFQAVHLLQHGWLPMNMWLMGACAFHAATASSSKAEMLMCLLTGSGDNAADVDHPHLAQLWTGTAMARRLALCFTQLGMPHPIATAEGVHALLKACQLRGICKQLQWCVSICTLPPCKQLWKHLLLHGHHCWVCRVVRTAIAAEPLTACRVQAQQQHAIREQPSVGSAAASGGQ